MVALHLSPARVVVAAGSSVAVAVIAELDDHTARPMAAGEVELSIADPKIASVAGRVVSGLSEGRTTLTARAPLHPAVAAVSASVVVAERVDPVVTRLGIDEAGPGDLLPIFGDHLTSPLGETTVRVGDLDATVVESGRHLVVARLPSDAVSGGVAVTVAGREARDRPWLHILAPAVDDPEAGRYFVAAGSLPGETSITFTVDLPDGTPVAATAADGGAAYRGHRVESAGGKILAGVPARGGGYGYASILTGAAYRILTVEAGQVEVVYGTGNLTVAPTEQRVARVVLLPATRDGQVAGRDALALAEVEVVGARRAVFLPEDVEVVANGSGDTLHFRLTDLTDGAGRPLPDGTRIAITAANNGCDWRGHRIESAGGTILGGTAASGSGYGYFSELDGSAYRIFTVEGGEVEGDYTPDPVTVRAGSRVRAMLQALLARADGTLAGRGAIAITPISLVPPATPEARVEVAPAALLADGGDRQAVVTVTGLTGPGGRPLPEGTRLAVTVADNGSDGGGYRVHSVGGRLVGGVPVEGSGYGYFSELDGDAYRLFPVVDGTVEIVYSAADLTLPAGEQAIARLQLLPADGDGHPIDNDAILVVEVPLAGAASGRIEVAGQGAPGEVLSFRATDLTDAFGAPLPEGTRLAVTVADHGSEYRGNDVASAGGLLFGGAPAAEGRYGYRGDLTADVYPIYTVHEGEISGWLQLSEKGGTTLLQLLPATPEGRVIGRRALTIRSVVVVPAPGNGG